MPTIRVPQFQASGFVLYYVDILRQCWDHEVVRKEAEGRVLTAPQRTRKRSRSRSQAEFGIHQDVDNNLWDRRMTCVFILSNTQSSVQIAGRRLCTFDRPGKGWGFCSKTYHGTGNTDPNTMKLAAFWGPPL